MPRSLSKLLDPAAADQPAAGILAVSPSVLGGVSAEAAEQLRRTLGIATVRELAEHPALAAARAVLAYTGLPGFDPGPPPPWERIFAAAPLAAYTAHPSGRFRTDFGPVYYRGRLDGAAASCWWARIPRPMSCWGIASWWAMPASASRGCCASSGSRAPT